MIMIDKINASLPGALETAHSTDHDCQRRRLDTAACLYDRDGQCLLCGTDPFGHDLPRGMPGGTILVAQAATVVLVARSGEVRTQTHAMLISGLAEHSGTSCTACPTELDKLEGGRCTGCEAITDELVPWGDERLCAGCTYAQLDLMAKAVAEATPAGAGEHQ
jgi:hypothetical protein